MLKHLCILNETVAPKHRHLLPPVFCTHPPSKILMRVGSVESCLADATFSPSSTFDRSQDSTPFIFLPKQFRSAGPKSGFSCSSG